MLLNIEKLIYGGDGLARLPGSAPKDATSGDKDHKRGKAVFVPFVLAGEKIEASLTEEKPGFARAHANTIMEPSSHRIPPPCPHFTRCGGCHYQHAAYEHQLEIKKEILRENLRRIAKLELRCEIQLHPSPPWNYRNRSRLQVRTQPNFAAGYFKFASHELLPVEECPDQLAADQSRHRSSVASRTRRQRRGRRARNRILRQLPTRMEMKQTYCSSSSAPPKRAAPQYARGPKSCAQRCQK